METSLHQSFSNLLAWSETSPTSTCSTAYGIKEVLKMIYEDRIHIISPEISNGYSPAIEDETSGVLFYISAINQSLESDGYTLKKPLVAFWESKIPSQVSESSKAMQLENSLWQMMVILPKNHTSINGNSLERTAEAAFLIDSFGLDLQMPKLIKYLIQNEIEIRIPRENSPALKFGGLFPGVNIEEKSLKLHEHPHESGLWCVFNAVMLISSGNNDFLEPFSMYDPCFSLKLRAILNTYNIKLDMSPKSPLPESNYDSNEIEIINIEIRSALISEISGWGMLEKEMKFVQKHLKIHQLCTVWEYQQSNLWGEAKKFIKKINIQLSNKGSSSWSLKLNYKSSTPNRPPKIQSITPPTNQTIMTARLDSNLSINNGKFTRAVKNKSFIDKSLLIKEILTNGALNTLIVRPQKLGKTLNMNMLKSFFHPKYDAYGNFKKLYLFTGGKDNIDVNNLDKTKCLNIITEDNGYYYKNFAGKIPIIFLNFSIIFERIDNESAENYLHNALSEVIKNAYLEYYPEYLESLEKIIKEYVSVNPNVLINIKDKDISELEMIIDTYKLTLPSHVKLFRKYKDDSSSIMEPTAVPNLAKFAHKFYKKQVIIIMDDYDTPLIQVINTPYEKAALRIIGKFMDPICIEALDCIFKVIMVGNIPIKGKGLPWLRYVNIYTVQDIEYSRFFGFTESEVNTLIEKNLQSNSEKDVLEQKGLIKLWYNGYNLCGEKIYNPHSIINCINKGKTQNSNPLQPYWIFAYDLNPLVPAFNALQSYDELFEIMRTGYLELPREIDRYINLSLDFNSTQNFFTLLLHAGYLTPYSTTKMEEKSLATTWIYVVPNREIKKHFYNTLLLEWISRKLGSGKVNIDKIVNEFDTSLDNKFEFQNLIQSKILDEMVDKTSKTEADFQILLGGIAMLASIMTINSNYILHSEAPNKFRKKVDGIFIPTKHKKTSVIIHEYKKIDTADTSYAKEKAEDALWQIYAKQYMKIAFDLRDSDRHYRYFDKMIVRGIIFFKAQYGENWNMLIKEHSFDFNNALKINEVFTSDEGGILAGSAVLCGESGSQSDKLEARRSLGGERISNLIKNITGDSEEETLIMKRKLDPDKIKPNKKPKLRDN
ncbi:unnamed protein product [Blepharisma stoltei]|uniref:AAA-ATPase-like domain-containing protein n=1 Tax=Blepharisma stoltei TaxID=1481888 RepID=A0AAU9KD95_9CILI|nr:unnamed protein product [Blepharisma stoltei]